MKKKRLMASISLDLDDQWSYMKVHGDEGWDKFPSYLDVVLPITLDVLDKLDIKITFFIVGQDAAIEKNHAVLKSKIIYPLKNLLTLLFNNDDSKCKN